MATVVSVRVPAPSSMLVVNVLGVVCLIGLAVAVGGLTSNAWWSLLVGCVEGLTLSLVWAWRLEDEQKDREPGAELSRVA